MNRQQVTEALNKMHELAQKAIAQTRSVIAAYDAQKSKAAQEQATKQN
jgi:hypothetical protein